MRNKIDKYDLGVIGYIFMILFGLGLGIYMIYSGIKDSNKVYSKFNSTIGTEVIIQKDTLQVIDFNSLYGTVKLSNNISINYDFYTKVKMNKQNEEETNK